MNVLKHEKKLAVLSALVEGNSIRSVVRMTGVHKTTILRLVADVGEGCAQLMDREMRNLMLALFFAYYNFCRIHGALRVTPAMAAGLTDRVWNLSDLIG